MSKSKSSSKTSNLRFDQVNTEPIIPNNNTIDEDPELNTEAELSEAELGKKFLTKIANGSSINSILTFFSCSPVIMLLLSTNAFTIGGIFPCIIFYILFIFATYLSLCMLLRMIIEKRSNSYFQMVIAFLNKKARILFDVFYFMFYIGYLLINVIVVQKIIENFFVKVETKKNLIITLIGIGVMLILQIVMAIKRTIEYWRIFKFIQVIIVFIGSITFYIVSLVKGKQNEEKKENIFFNFNQDFFLMFAMMNIFLFNQFNLFQEIQFLKGFSKKRGLSVLTNTLLLQFFTFIVLGLFGFLCLKGENGNYLFFFMTSPTDNISDIFYLLMNIFFLFVFLTELSHTLVVISDFIRYFIAKNELPLKFHILNICFIAFIANLVAYFLKNVECLIKIIISVIGGICAAVIEYVIPGILYLTVENKMGKNNKLLTVFLMVWMMILGLAVTICGITFCFISNKKQ